MSASAGPCCDDNNTSLQDRHDLTDDNNASLHGKPYHEMLGGDCHCERGHCDCHGFEPQSKDSGRWLGRGQIVGLGRMLDHTIDQVWPDWYQGSMTAAFGYSTEPVA